MPAVWRLLRRLRRRRRPWLILAATAAVLYFVPTGLYVLEPGIVADTVGMVTVQGGARDAAGRFMLVTVAARPAGLGLVLWKALDPDAVLAPERALIPRGKDPESFFADARLQMRESQVFAVCAALRHFALPAQVGGRGFRVLGVFPGTPADGVLFPGDIVVSAGGRPVQTSDDFRLAVQAVPPGRRLAVVVQRDGRRREAVLEAGEGVRRSGFGGLGIEGVTEDPAARFPVSVDFRVGEVAGPSAGLMFALEVLDQLDRSRDLTGGRTVAGTGIIWPSGEVGAVGGVRQKVAAARRAGAEVFLAPAAEADEARRATGSMRVIPVNTLEEAVAALAPPGRTGGAK